MTPLLPRQSAPFMYLNKYRLGFGNWWQVLYVLSAIAGARFAAGAAVNPPPVQTIAPLEAFAGGFLALFGSRLAGTIRCVLPSLYGGGSELTPLLASSPHRRLHEVRSIICLRSFSDAWTDRPFLYVVATACRARRCWRSYRFSPWRACLVEAC